MTTTSIRATAMARYKGLQVTIVGDTRAALLAIAGYRTQHELAIATIEAKCCGARCGYRVASTLEWTDGLQVATEHAVKMREIRDTELPKDR